MLAAHYPSSEGNPRHLGAILLSVLLILVSCTTTPDPQPEESLVPAAANAGTESESARDGTAAAAAPASDGNTGETGTAGSEAVAGTGAGEGTEIEAESGLPAVDENAADGGAQATTPAVPEAENKVFARPKPKRKAAEAATRGVEQDRAGPEAAFPMAAKSSKAKTASSEPGVVLGRKIPLPKPGTDTTKQGKTDTADSGSLVAVDYTPANPRVGDTVTISVEIEDADRIEYDFGRGPSDSNTAVYDSFGIKTVRVRIARGVAVLSAEKDIPVLGTASLSLDATTASHHRLGMSTIRAFVSGYGDYDEVRGFFRGREVFIRARSGAGGGVGGSPGADAGTAGSDADDIRVGESGDTEGGNGPGAAGETAGGGEPAGISKSRVEESAGAAEFRDEYAIPVYATGEMTYSAALYMAGKRVAELGEITITGLNEPPRRPRYEGDQIIDVQVGVPFSFVIRATDPNADEILYAARFAPDGSEFDPETGEFRWTPRADQVGFHLVNFRAYDLPYMTKRSFTQRGFVVTP